MTKIVGKFKEDLFLTIIVNLFSFICAFFIFDQLYDIICKHFFNTQCSFILTIITLSFILLGSYFDYKKKYHFITIDDVYNVKLEGRFKVFYEFNLSDVTQCLVNQSHHFGRGHMSLRLAFKNGKSILIPSFKSLNKHLVEYLFLQGVEISYLRRSECYQIKDISQIEKL